MYQGAIPPSGPSPASSPRRRRRLVTPRAVVSIGAVVAIIGLVISVFVTGGGAPAPGGTAAVATGASSAAAGPTTTVAPQPVDPSAQKSCSDFDLATARLAAKDNKGFIDDMTDAATEASDAATRDQQWKLLVGNFAAFATDLSANDATSVFNDLEAVNQQCAAVRGERQLVLNSGPAQPSTTSTAPSTAKAPSTTRA